MNPLGSQESLDLGLTQSMGQVHEAEHLSACRGDEGPAADALPPFPVDGGALTCALQAGIAPRRRL